jgi:hypothetical protein
MELMNHCPNCGSSLAPWYDTCPHYGCHGAETHVDGSSACDDSCPTELHFYQDVL